MSTTKYSLEWNEFESMAEKTYKDLLCDNNFTDVTLACDDDKQINAHKIILSSCSPFFERLFMKNSNKDLLIYLKGVTFSDLELVMRFVYLGEAEIDQLDLERFLKVSKELEIKGLTENVVPCDDIGMNLMKNNETDEEYGENLSGESETNLTEEETGEYGNVSCGDETIESEIETTEYMIENIEEVYRTNSKRKKSIGAYSLKCNDCEMQFSSQGSLLNHTRYKHDGVMYSCDFCEYKAGQAGNLKRHVGKNHSK